jgi:hypothetical protein
MSEPGRFCSERSVQHDVAGSVGKMVFAPYDVRDSHTQIINHVCEVERGRSIGPQNNEITDYAGPEGDPPSHDVVHNDRLALGHEEAHDRFAPFLCVTLFP